MRCTDCELSINSCLGICDARCLVKNDDITFEQVKTLLESSYWQKNIPLMNIFFQRKAAQMIKAMFTDERLTVICVAIYKGKLSEKQLAMARAKSKKIDEALNCENIKELILSL